MPKRKLTAEQQAAVDYSRARRDEIKLWNAIHSDLPDGAYLAMMEEHGVSAEEIADVLGDHTEADDAIKA